MDRETSQLVFGAVKRREREVKEGGREEGSVKRQKMDVQREGCPVVMLTGISQSIAKKLKTVSDVVYNLCHVHLMSMSHYTYCRLSYSLGAWSLIGQPTVLT